MVDDKYFFILYDIKLGTYTTVNVTSFSMQPTYQGFYAGQLTPLKNQEYINNAIPKDYTSEFAHMIIPDDNKIQTILPPIKYKAHLQDSDLMLTVIWFGDDPGERSIKEIIVDGIYGIDWKNIAKEIQF